MRPTATAASIQQSLSERAWNRRLQRTGNALGGCCTPLSTLSSCCLQQLQSYQSVSQDANRYSVPGHGLNVLVYLVAEKPACFSSTRAHHRLYQAVMAHHVLCPQRKTQQQCNTDELIYCIWNQQRESCEADRYASYLLPLACPGSMAHAYLDCMRKANADACKADSTCTAAYNGTCYPRSMVAGAHRSQVPVQSAAEEMALAIVTGEYWSPTSIDSTTAHMLTGRAQKVSRHHTSTTQAQVSAACRGSIFYEWAPLCKYCHES